MGPKIDTERFFKDLDGLREIGRQGNGVVRISLSPSDMTSRRWLVERFGEAGLQSKIDNAGNVVGISPNPGPALLLGSHTDTQPIGGWLDGAYGVISALEAVRTLREHPETSHLALDVASFLDEEGNHHSFIGSLSATGQMTQAELDAVHAIDGRPIQDWYKEAGVPGKPEPLDLSRYAGFMELHIEQGPVLDKTGQKLAVVSGIVGFRNIDVTFYGEANHAGSTPMSMRHDAGRAMFTFANAVDEAFSKLASPLTVWNFGSIEFFPGAPAIVPERSEMRVQFRDTDDSILDKMEAVLEPLAKQAAEKWDVTYKCELHCPHTPAAIMDDKLQQHLRHAAEELAPDNWTTIPSGAVHDAGVVAKVMPSAMLFVPSIGGRSHCEEEDTPRDDLALGTQALVTAIYDWAKQNGHLAK